MPARGKNSRDPSAGFLKMGGSTDSDRFEVLTPLMENEICDNGLKLCRV